MSMSFVGLLTIPIIVKPIDHVVEFVFNKTIRRWYCIGSKMQEKKLTRNKKYLFYSDLNQAERDCIEGRRFKS